MHFFAANFFLKHLPLIFFLAHLRAGFLSKHMGSASIASIASTVHDCMSLGHKLPKVPLQTLRPASIFTHSCWCSYAAPLYKYAT